MKSTAVKTLSVPEAGKLYFGFGPQASYRAAHRGDIPTVRIGKFFRVPVAELEAMLAEAGREARAKAAAIRAHQRKAA